MIIHAQIAEQPIAGTFKEYLFSAPTSTEHWAWIKLLDDSYIESFGQFPGAPNQVALSTKQNLFYVLTQEFLFEIQRNDVTSYKYYDFWDLGSTFKNVTFTPKEMPIFSDDYHIFTIHESFENRKEFNLPFELDMIQFGIWTNHLLTIDAEVFIEGRPVKLVLDSQTMQIKQIP